MTGESAQLAVGIALSAGLLLCASWLAWIGRKYHRGDLRRMAALTAGLALLVGAVSLAVLG
jgi:hypothetical protein